VVSNAFSQSAVRVHAVAEKASQPRKLQPQNENAIPERGAAEIVLLARAGERCRFPRTACRSGRGHA
jgi:hypothetical protein